MTNWTKETPTGSRVIELSFIFGVCTKCKKENLFAFRTNGWKISKLCVFCANTAFERLLTELPEGE